jgi:hypothetical protein
LLDHTSFEVLGRWEIDHGPQYFGYDVWSHLGHDTAVTSAVTILHTAAMMAVAGVVALVFYEVVGLRILRTAWVNLDQVWACALVGAGVATVALAL